MEKHKHGGDIYSQSYIADFSANINPLGPPQGVKDAIRACVDHIQNYPDVTKRKLTRALAQKEEVKEEWIVFGNGAAELIFALCQGLRPKKALLVTPGFAEYEQALESVGCEISYYALSEEQGYLLSEDYLEQITPNLDMIFLCNPNNPTGTLTEREMLCEIARKCKDYEICLVIDECFRDFIEEPERYSMKQELSNYQNLFLLGAFTKIYAMAGLRLGYGFCVDASIHQKLQKVLQPWNISIPAQEAGVAALKEDTYVEQARALVAEERKFLRKKLEALGLQVTNGKANYLFFQGPEGLEKRCREQGYLIRDCGNYRGLQDGYYRIAVRTPQENRAFIRILSEIVKSDNGQKPEQLQNQKKEGEESWRKK